MPERVIETVKSDERITVSVDEAAQIGIQFLMRGQVSDAGLIFSKLLSVAPRHPESLHFSGIVAFKQGDTDEGIERIRQSLELKPDQPDWHSNLGILLESAGDGEGAIRAFERAIELSPSHANAHNNLGVLQRIFGRLEEAEANLRAAIAIVPDYADAYRNLAAVLEQTGRMPEAVVAYCKAVTIRPANPSARRMLVIAYTTVGEMDKALEVCREWIKIAPDDPLARHTLAAVSQRDIPPRAADSYIVNTFDSFAETFEAKLTRLDYKAPTLVVGSLAETGMAAEGVLDVLDAGCGTGWCGPLLAPYARTLTGVDLSKGMLEHARAKGVYDELVEAELVGYLQQHPLAYDVVVSADTLVYFGGLEGFAQAVSQALRPGGWVIFTVEEAKPETATYHLEVHGRFNHSAEYVERVLTSAGLTPHIGHAALRLEHGLPVAGLVVRARKMTGDDRA